MADPTLAKLSDLFVSIKSKLYSLFGNPIVLLGINASGDPTPVLVGADGTLAVTTETVADITEVRSTALEASHVLKAAPGKLKQLTINNTAGSTQFYLLMNSATLPGDGAVTLLFPPIPVAAGTIAVLDFPTPLVASTGLVISNGPNNSFTKAIGAADSVFYAQVI